MTQTGRPFHSADAWGGYVAMMIAVCILIDKNAGLEYDGCEIADLIYQMTLLGKIDF